MFKYIAVLFFLITLVGCSSLNQNKDNMISSGYDLSWDITVLTRSTYRTNEVGNIIYGNNGLPVVEKREYYDTAAKKWVLLDWRVAVSEKQ